MSEENVVTLDEEGYHDDPNSEEDTWIQTGWRVRTYRGNVLYRHNEKQPVQEWLLANGYTVAPDSDEAHYTLTQEHPFLVYPIEEGTPWK